MNTTKELLNIVVQGRKEYSTYLEKNLNIKNKITYVDTNNDHFVKSMKECDIVITMSWGKSVWGGKEKIKIPKCDNLKLIHLPGAGLDAIDFKKVPNNCSVCNVYEHEITIAEYCIANMLNWEHQIFQKNIQFKKLDWRGSIIFSGKTCNELNEKTVGILGYGRIGKEIAKKLKVFSTKCIAITRKEITKDKNIHSNYLTKDLENIISKLDYLIIACPLNESTKNLISKKKLSLMKETAVIINIARGSIVNEKDLYEVLSNHRIGGAIIDTWYNYPSSKKENGISPSLFDYHKLNNIVMTPHLSAWSEPMLKRRFTFIARNIENLVKNRKLKNIVFP